MSVDETMDLKALSGPPMDFAHPRIVYSKWKEVAEVLRVNLEKGMPYFTYDGFPLTTVREIIEYLEKHGAVYAEQERRQIPRASTSSSSNV